MRIEPAYDFLADKKSILLRRDTAKLLTKNEVYIGVGEARLDLLPQPRVHCYGSFECQSVSSSIKACYSSGDDYRFFLGSLGIPGFDVSRNVSLGNSGELRIIWQPASEPVSATGNESTQIDSVVFHVFNFVEFIGSRRSSVQENGGTRIIEHIDLSCDEWTGEIRSLPSTADSFKVLKAEGGCRLTHVGRFSKSDGSSFTGNEANEYLRSTCNALSFAKGAWCYPVCPVGFDTQGNRVWESWLSPKEHWQKPQSWFSPHHGSQLSEMFAKYSKQTSDSRWRTALEEVIYRYLNANKSHGSTSVNVGIISAQAAIERISSEYIVNDKRLITANQFSKKRASDRFRFLIQQLNIASEIPDHTPVLQKLAYSRNWEDAPHALTDIRNALVHPNRTEDGRFNANVYFEAWNLWLWYLEMAILAICGYNNTYENRLDTNAWVGEVNEVPWM